MFLEIDEKLKERIEEETQMDYGFKDNMINVLEINNLIDDLLADIEFYKDRYNDLKRDIEDNYEPIKQANQYE